MSSPERLVLVSSNGDVQGRVASISAGSTARSRLDPTTRMYTLSTSTQAGNASSIQGKKPTVTRSTNAIA